MLYFCCPFLLYFWCPLTSGLATKQGLRPANCVGVIDSDYRGEVIVAIHNDSNVTQKVNYGDRIAQLVVMPFLSVHLNKVNELSDTVRGEGGFGSTGVSIDERQISFDDIMGIKG